MKPSERIAKLIMEFQPNYPAPDRSFRAIIQYLDEVYEMEEIARYNLKEKLIPME